MKILIIGISSLLYQFFSSSIYNITIDTLQNGPVSLSVFKGKKILIVTLKKSNKAREQLLFLDSLQNANKDSLVIIAIPSFDLDEKPDERLLKKFQQDLTVKFIITKPVFSKNGLKQHPLLRWIADVNENSHFGTDIKEEGQIFMISKKGTLYAALRNKVPSSVLKKVISQEINE